MNPRDVRKENSHAALHYPSLFKEYIKLFRNGTGRQALTLRRHASRPLSLPFSEDHFQLPNFEGPRTDKLNRRPRRQTPIGENLRLLNTAAKMPLLNFFWKCIFSRFIGHEVRREIDKSEQ